MGEALVRALPEAAVIEGPNARVVREQTLGVARVQTLADDADAWLERLLGVAAPAPLREVMVGAIGCAWLAPGEWLLTGPEAEIAQWCERGDAQSLIVDLSHARAAFELSGSAARTVLAAHCPLDLSPAKAPVGAALRSTFSDTVVFISRKANRDGQPVFQLIFDQTMARYAARMLAGTLAGASA